MKYSIGMIVPQIGGGTYRYANDLVNAWIEQEALVLLMEPNHRIVKISVLYKNKKISREIEMSDGDEIEDICKKYRIQIIHVHHFIKVPQPLRNLSLKLATPMVVSLHDYYSICPFVNLMCNDRYCEEKGEPNCNLCLKTRIDKSYELRNVTDIRIWRKKNYELLKRAELITVPSNDMRKRLSQYFPQLLFKVYENPELIKPNNLKKKTLINHVLMLG